MLICIKDDHKHGMSLTLSNFKKLYSVSLQSLVKVCYYMSLVKIFFLCKGLFITAPPAPPKKKKEKKEGQKEAGGRTD